MLSLVGVLVAFGVADWRWDVLERAVGMVPLSYEDAAEVEAALVLLAAGMAVLLFRWWRALGRELEGRRAADEALRRSERLLADAQALARVGAWEFHPATGALWWSDENFRLFGLEPGAVAPSYGAYMERVHPDDRASVEATVREALRSGGVFAHPQRVVLPGGEVRHQRVHGEVVMDGGHPVRVLGVVQDVTERVETERALRASEERLALALESTDQGLWDWNVATGEVHFSAQWARMLGYAAGEVEPHVRAWESLVHPDDIAGVMRVLEAHLRGDTPLYETEHRMRAADGRWVWILDRGRVIDRDPDGRPLRMTGTHADVTARREAALAVETAHAHYRRLVTTSPSGIFVLDTAGRFVEVNPAGETLLARPAADVLASHFGALLVDDDIPAATRAFARLLGGDAESTELELRVHHPDGAVRLLSVTVAAVWEDGTVTGVQGIARDVTEERRTAESRERLLQILEATPDFVGLADAHGAVLYRNPAARRLLGISGAERTEGTTFHDATLRPAWAEAVFRDVALPTAAREGIWMGELAFQGRGGEEIPVWQVLLAHPAPDGAPAYFSTIARDLRERRSLEEQLRHAQKLEAVGKLAGGVAHDFNNMLMVIRGFASLLHAEVPAGTAAAGYLAEIEGAAARSAEITGQLLAFSRRQVLRPRVLDIRDVVGGVDRMLRPLIGADVELVTRLGTRPARVSADPAQLEQVLVSVALNARDAMPHGGRLVVAADTVELLPREAAALLPGSIPPGRYVRIELADTGRGMDAATLARAFEPFFTTKEVGQGTGLGLSSAYGTVRQSGGYVSAESEPGRGTRVVVWLPEVEAPAAAPPPAEVAFAALAPDEATATILLVEDESAVRTLARVTLERAGYAVVEAEDGAQALQLAAAVGDGIALVVTDVVMPRMGGPELAARLRTGRPGLPVVFMSGYTEDVALHRGISARERHLLHKPFTAGHLLDTVRGVLDPAGASPLPAAAPLPSAPC